MASNQFYNRNKLNFLSRWWLDLDKTNFFLIISLMIFGLVINATASPAVAEKISSSKFFFLKKQLVFAFLSLLIIITISFLKHEYIKILSICGLICAILMLFGVLAFGVEIKGAKRWISLGGFVLQPSEFVKTFFVVVNAYILFRLQKQQFYIKYGASAALFLMIATLLILQPDFGMSVTLSALFAAQLFLSGISLIFVVICAILAVFGAISAYFILPHVKDRVNRFLDLDSANYQVERSLDAYVNGGFLGTGQGNGVVKNYIPDAHTDFIFAVIGEEFGILTCILVIMFFAYLITRIVKKIMDEEDIFTYLALFGLMMQFCMQVIINIGVSLRLFPTKGMTLPFISYGGSSMLSMAICFGMILLFTKKKYNSNIDYGNIKII